MISLGLFLSSANGQNANKPVSGVDILEKVIERRPVPADVLADAVVAVQNVGDQTLKGEYAEVVEKMYPRFQQRSAKKLGGKAKMALEMKAAVDKFAASGMKITNLTAEPALHGFEIPEFREWLVFVPTTRTVRRIDPETGLAQRLEITDYQAAIRKHDGKDWTFLNGSTLSLLELRSLFPSLPNGIEKWAIPEKGFKRLP